MVIIIDHGVSTLHTNTTDNMRKIMKRMLLIGCFLILSMTLSSFAMANENAVGLSFGPTKGNGRTYRTIDFGTGIGYQFSALPLVGPNEGLVTGGASAASAPSVL